MNKYLLLRDNKQSGPYTVPEIIEIGIKPYDLVWLEGKSAAWRYPSEVEELKAYSPTVEEQPFDRFYKKPEPVLKPTPAPAVEHTAYEPKVAADTIVEEVAAPKKVYINFPVHSNTVKNVVKEAAPVYKQPIAETPSYPEKYPSNEGFAEKTFYRQANEVISSRHTKAQSDRKYVYGAIAASVVLIGFIAILLVNNNHQEQKLQELNTIVKQIENKKATDQVIQATQVKNEVAPVTPPPAEQSTSETIVNPELLTENDYSKKPAATPAKSDPVANTPKEPVARKIENNDGSAVFTERPVLRRTDKAETTPSATNESSAPAASENLFRQVSLTPNKYKVGVLGGISNLQLALTNNSKRELHKVAVEIKYFGPEKKVVNTQTIYFENVSPGASTTLDIPRSKRGVSIGFTVTDIKS